MTNFEMIKYLVEKYNVPYAVAHEAVRNNDGDLMMAGGEIRDRLEGQTQADLEAVIARSDERLTKAATGKPIPVHVKPVCKTFTPEYFALFTGGLDDGIEDLPAPEGEAELRAKLLRQALASNEEEARAILRKEARAILRKQTEDDLKRAGLMTVSDKVWWSTAAVVMALIAAYVIYSF